MSPILCFFEDGRFGQREQYDVFAGCGAHFVMEAHQRVPPLSFYLSSSTFFVPSAASFFAVLSASSAADMWVYVSVEEG